MGWSLLQIRATWDDPLLLPHKEMTLSEGKDPWAVSFSPLNQRRSVKKCPFFCLCAISGSDQFRAQFNWTASFSLVQSFVKGGLNALLNYIVHFRPKNMFHTQGSFCNITSAGLVLNFFIYGSSRMPGIQQITLTFRSKLLFHLSSFSKMPTGWLNCKMNWVSAWQFGSNIIGSSVLSTHLASRRQQWAAHQSATGGWASRPSPGRDHRWLRPRTASLLGTQRWWHSSATPCHISSRSTI